MRVVKMLAAALCGVALVAGVSVTPASATVMPHGITQDGVYFMVNQGTKRCLDDSKAFGLRMFGCNGQTFQQWRLHGLNESGTAWTIENENTKSCVQGSSTGALFTLPCNGLSVQAWWVGSFMSGDDPVAWFQNQKTNACLQDTVAHGLEAVGCNTDSPNQQFKLTP